VNWRNAKGGSGQRRELRSDRVVARAWPSFAREYTLAEMTSTQATKASGSRAIRSLARNVAFLLSLSVVGGASCRSAPSSDWDDLFESRPPVHLSGDPLRLVETVTDSKASVGRTSRLVSERDYSISLSALRDGRFTTAAIAEQAAVLAAYGPDLGGTFPQPQVVGDTPYWDKGIPFQQYAASGAGRTFVASNLFYPILVYDGSGVLIDSLNQRPRSWRDARRPSSGEFANVGVGADHRRRARDEYLHSLTVITGLALIADSVLLVNHGTSAREVSGRLEALPTTVDVYVHGTRVASDLPSPGEILAYSRTSVFFLARQASESALREYVWRNRD
jgi:hypothetical protein